MYQKQCAVLMGRYKLIQLDPYGLYTLDNTLLDMV